MQVTIPVTTVRLNVCLSLGYDRSSTWSTSEKTSDLFSSPLSTVGARAYLNLARNVGGAVSTLAKRRRGSSTYCKWPHSLRQGRVDEICALTGCPFPPKLPLCLGDLDPHLIHGSLDPPESSTQTASRSVQPFL